eukprot:11169343-Lingulodinium_polyedra.AAC.1
MVACLYAYIPACSTTFPVASSAQSSKSQVWNPLLLGLSSMAFAGASFWRGQLMAAGADREQLCLVAQRLPATQTCKDQVENNKRMRQRLCIQKVLDHMMKHPYTSESIWASVEAGLACDSGVTCNRKEESQLIKHQVVKEETDRPSFGRLDTKVMAGLLAAMPHGPDKELLDKMHDKDHHAIPDAFYLIFQVTPKDNIPCLAKESVVFTHALRCRLKNIGFDLKGWFQKCVDTEGTVNWEQQPMYLLGLDEEGDKIGTITYMNGDMAVIPPHVHISKEYSFVDAFSMYSARFDFQGNALFAYTFFDKKSGPNKFKLDSKGSQMESLAREAKAEIDNLKKQAAAVTDSPCSVSLTSRVKRQREQALARARIAAQSTPKKRRSLAYPEPPAASTERS